MYWVYVLSHGRGFYTVLALMPIVLGLQNVAGDDMFLCISFSLTYDVAHRPVHTCT